MFKKIRISGFLVLTILIVLPFLNCSSSKEKVFYLNSYHKGYAPSDSITAEIKKILGKRKDIRLKIFYMDTKRNKNEGYINSVVEETLAAIEQFNPDVIIASDDNAVNYVISEHFKNGQIPVVFCGVNWQCKQYGLPTDYVTGMLEVLPVKQTLQLLKQYYPEAEKLAVLSEDSPSERKNRDILEPIYHDLGFTVEYYLVDTYSQWKDAFVKANEKADLIYAVTNGAIENWKEDSAEKFVKEHIKMPVFTNDQFMMRYSVIGLTKIASEQGHWAANTALEILKCENPANIPVTRNQKVNAFINKELAKEIEFHPSDSLKNKLKPFDAIK